MPMSGINKVELKQYSTKNIKVFIVDSLFIRNNVDIRWGGGGHYLAFPEFIPKGEVWIGDEFTDDGKLNDDGKFYLYHELIERREMSHGMSYDEAHYHIANAAEQKARQGKGNIDKLIEGELKKVTITLDPSIFNGQLKYHVDGKTHHANEMKKNRKMVDKCKSISLTTNG